MVFPDFCELTNTTELPRKIFGLKIIKSFPLVISKTDLTVISLTKNNFAADKLDPISNFACLYERLK